MKLRTPVPGIPGAWFQPIEMPPPPLDDGRAAGPRCQASAGKLLCVTPDIGSFMARDGTLIEYWRAEGADPGWVDLILHGTARGALIHQRGELPLHAATLVPPGGSAGIAICGHSGAGKSTLAAELSRRGWSLLADDTTRVCADETDMIAWPSRESIKLWRDACVRLDVDPAGLVQVAQALDKFYLPVKGHDAPAPLRAIVELSLKEPGPIASRVERMALITRHTYRPRQIRPLGVLDRHINIVAKAAQRCDVLRLPGDKSLSPARLADQLEAVIDL